MEKTTYIFDFDNTIVDSLDHWFEVMDRRTFTHFGLPVDEKMVKLREGKSNIETVKGFLELTGLDVPPEEILAFWNEAMEENYVKNIKLIDGVRDFLYDLKKQDKKLVLASATEESLLRIALKNFDLEIFEEVYTETTIGFPKHNAMFFETCLERLGAKAEEVVVFEDSFVSLRSANSLGIASVAVLNKYNESKKEELEKMCKLLIVDYKDINQKLHE